MKNQNKIVNFNDKVKSLKLISCIIISVADKPKRCQQVSNGLFVVALFMYGTLFVKFHNLVSSAISCCWMFKAYF